MVKRIFNFGSMRQYLDTANQIPERCLHHGQFEKKIAVQQFSEILQLKSKNGSYVLANHNANFKLRLKFVLKHAHESSL